MPARSLVVWLIVCSAAATAQVRPPRQANAVRVLPMSVLHASLDESASAFPFHQSSAPDSVKVLALMVDFQTSADNLTTGDGHFQLGTAASSGILDPAPHDSAYFAYKLQFLSNYFRKVSNGKVIVQGDLFGRVITLSKPLASYSPAKDGSNDKPLADLVVEAWHTADSLNPSIQFSRYNAFAIFHAGVGRDISLVSLLGFDPTPYDIPSITFNLRTLRNYLDDQTYAGIPVSHGAFRITNTMVLPETETRKLPPGSGIDSVKGSINGLLANSFGTYLGLPDLFNTKTGLPGIGQFGLMDATGLSYYAGLFPPEPSAWEKIYLGWVTPIIVGPGTSIVNLPAVGLKTGRDTVYKIPISDREYFLIENRSRDPQRNGQRLTLRQGNTLVTEFFSRDTAGFYFDDVSAIVGSVVDVEDFDWALPSLTTIDDTSYVGGGVLIWHIDEDVIARGLADNTVNADPSHRGVNLEEADGAKDIGQVYSPFSDAGAGTETGYQLDFWYDGNVARLYKNVFDKDSYPNSRSYTGAMSLVTIRDFSKRSPRMTATVIIGDDQFRRLPGFAREMPATTTVSPPSAPNSGVLLGIDGRIYAFKPDGSSKTKDSTGLLSQKGGALSLAATDLGNTLFIAGAQDSTLHLITALDKNADGAIDSVQDMALPLGERITTPAMFADLSITPSVVVGSTHGSVWSFTYAGAAQKKTVVSSSAVNSLAQLPTPSLSKPAELFFTCGGRLYGEQSSVALGDSSLPWIAAGMVSRSGNAIAVGQLGGRRLLAFSRDLSQKLFDVSVPGTVSSLAAADIDGDGEKDLVVVAGDRLCVLNRAGAFLAGFPITAPSGDRFVGNPLIGNVNGDGTTEIILSLASGRLAAYDKSGRLAAGYPVQLSASGESTLAFFQSGAGNLGIAGLTSAGSLQAIEISKPYLAQNIVWSQYLKDSRHSNVDASSGGTPSVSDEFLPRSRVYNWPNPVYGSTTQIRYYTPEDASISIKIFDLAGVKVAELRTQARGGLDGEIPWDVSGIQSGVYLARVEASGSSRTEVAIIKIAVVK